MGALQLSYISGSLLVVPADENLEEIYEMRSPAQIPTDVRDDLLQKMQIISHSKTYPPSRQAAIKDAIELVKKLINSDEKKQRFKQKSHAIAITPAVKSSAIIWPALLKNQKAKADGIFWKFIFALCTL
ncbi:hypothetical protein [Microseira wollei]|uniref:Helicase-like protein n=1 Tax=Microseira wollei NIES-4236 TaxID=2530354 RepID=A0AAV3XFY7_9CYAN|nr:hypothetical protein [Microseira wollei]GET41867.1 helicase-like protein [Microseira wollei NIES-4236]